MFPSLGFTKEMLFAKGQEVSGDGLSFSSHRDPLVTFVDSGIIVEVFFPGLISSILFFPREESILNKFYVR